MCTVLVASLSFQDVTQHLCKKAFPLLLMFSPDFLTLSACCFTFLDHIAFLLHSAKHGDLTCCSCWLMGCSVTCWRTGDLLKSSVSLEKSGNLISITPLLSLYTCTCTFFIPGCVKGCRFYHRFFFVFVVVCLFLYRQACRYLLIYVNLFC